MKITEKMLIAAGIKKPSVWLELLNYELENEITHPNDVACFLAQCSYESSGFTRLKENMNYTSTRLVEVFKTRNGLNGQIAERLCLEGEKSIADFVYGGEFGKKSLGNIAKHDGSRFIGRGIIQLTGRYNYDRYGKKIGVDLINEPELACEKQTAVALAVAYWKDKKCSKHAIDDNCNKVSSLIVNGNEGCKDNGSFAARRTLYYQVLNSMT